MTDTEPSAVVDTGRPGWTMRMMMDPGFARDPRPYYTRLRQGPPARDELDIPGRTPSVMVSRHRDVERVLRDPHTFSSRFGSGLSGLGNDRPMIPLQIDPPGHKRYRVLLDPYLAPRQVARLEADVTDLVNHLIDGFIDRGGCEFTSEFAVPLPCTVFLRLLGLPLEDLDLFLRLKEGIIRGGGERTLAGQFEARRAAGQECYAYFEEALDRIAADRVDGLLLQLLEAEVDGARLSRDEILDICYVFIIAGLDTVTDSLCCFWSYLASHPGSRRAVADPATVPDAVEELLRWESPVTGVARVVAEDTEIDGCPMRRGENVFVLVGAANTDPAAVPDADRVDFARPANRHYAFGGGIHRCLGSHLARMELRVAMREWHRRIPDYRIPDGTELVWTPILRAVERLPLTFGAAAP